MSEKPILFSGEMVRAIRTGRKTQTRRVVKTPGKAAGFFITSNQDGTGKWPIAHDEHEQMYDNYMKCPYGEPGDVLWVQESWCDVYDIKGMNCPPRENKDCDAYYYEADYDPETAENCVIEWRSNRDMPREAARLFLRVKSVRVERLQDISIDDARAEGIPEYIHQFKDNYTEAENDVWRNRTTKENFAALWDSIYGKSDANKWDANPWVWVVEFEVQP